MAMSSPTRAANVVTIAVAGLLLAGAGAAIAYRRNREQTVKARL